MGKMGENARNYESIKKETNIYEQKSINIDDFNEAEEAWGKIAWKTKAKIDERLLKKTNFRKKKSWRNKNKGKEHVELVS